MIFTPEKNHAENAEKRGLIPTNVEITGFYGERRLDEFAVFQRSEKVCFGPRFGEAI